MKSKEREKKSFQIRADKARGDSHNPIIEIGIDLGTTNSSIAVNVNGKIEIIKRPGGVEYTPSVFGFDKSGNKIVGQKAYEQLYKYNSSGANKKFKAEIKRLMGTPETISFETVDENRNRVETRMSPEEISAEILKSLKEDVLRAYPNFDTTTAAVITVPADFIRSQIEATKRAGELAGFRYVVLLQEPIASALSYAHKNPEHNNENWLIYDLGGGTFDVALVFYQDGQITVLNHKGDNFLGGKNMDWAIVDDIIVPQLRNKYQLPEFTRDNARYERSFQCLKYLAEDAKKELSQQERTTIELDGIGEDESGKEICMSIGISRKELEELIAPEIGRTIELTKETLQEAGIENSSVNRIILVGGPTLMPYVRERLRNDLHIELDSSVDPLTVVAHGACVHARSEIIPEALETDTKKPEPGTHKLDLHHDPVTPDTEALVTGSIDGLNDQEQYYVQIHSGNGTFTGPKVKVNKGTFAYTVNVELNKQNVYRVYLFDNKSNSVKVFPNSFVITHGVTLSGGPPIPHSIQVVVLSRDPYTKNQRNVCETIFEKGSALELTKALDCYKTSRALRRGEGGLLDIEIVEGESPTPDCNDFVCTLGIPAEELEDDLPAGTMLDLTLNVNKSGELTATVYIPRIKQKLYLFSWDDVPNKINERFTKYIEKLMKQKNLGEGRITVEKPDNKRIKVSTSTDGKFLLLKLNDEKTEVDVEIDGKIIGKFIAEAEESKLNVYRTFNACATISDRPLNPQNLKTELERQKERVDKVLNEDSSSDTRTKILGLVRSISKHIDNATNDLDEGRQAISELKRLKVALTEIEEEGRMPALIKEYNDLIAYVGNVIEQCGDGRQRNEYREQLKGIKTDGDRAAQNDDKVTLTSSIDQLRTLYWTIRHSNPALDFEETAMRVPDTDESRRLTEKGKIAIRNEDNDALARCTEGLKKLIPQQDDPNPPKESGADIERWHGDGQQGAVPSKRPKCRR